MTPTENEVDFRVQLQFDKYKGCMAMQITYRKATRDDNDKVTNLLCKLYEIPMDELFIENERHSANTDMVFSPEN